MRVGPWDFNPSVLPTLATLFVIPVLASLGAWQLQRADQKAALHRAYLERSSAAPLAGEAVTGVIMDREAALYRRLRLRGRYDAAPQYLLDNQVHGGVAGYDVFTPFMPGDESIRILVNRGWVPAGPDRTQVPAIETPADTVEMIGQALPPPAQGLALAAAVPEAMGRGLMRVQRIQLEEIAARHGWALTPVVIRLDPGSAGGFVRDWPAPGSGRERHLGYAFQWFALAALLAVIYVAVNLKRRDRPRIPPACQGPDRA